MKNVGTETVAIPDLQTLGRESNDLRRHGVGVRVATLPPARAGYTDPPLLWSRVDPASTAQSSGKPSVLARGGEQTLQTGNWSDKSGAGRIFAQGFFAFYAGPPVADGHLMMRGYALSSAVDIAKRHAP